MLRQCVTLAVLGCVLAVPAPQHQYQPQPQQAAGFDPHLLRQYLADQQAAAPAPAQTQVLQRPQHAPQAAPRPAPQQLYTSQAQYQPQPQHQPQYQPQPQQQQYRPQPQYQPQRPQEQREPEEYDPNPSYQFGFDVNDDQYTNYQNRKEQRDGDTIKGSYSVVDSDGFIRTVTYTADPKEGFKAEVSRQPTDIVVKIPTPKPQQLIQPQVQHAAHAQPRPQQPQQHQPQIANPQQYYRYEQ
ncbi:hypothetical protein PYW07_015141 [Mythimna separata]|uniref:Uncharacterized protein n=1 Tax=Mythimna separata TaxID=271217 RepID=A0AAD8DZI9_MYTSE|nr:hypothetical protein PYW07_015141 [Mythimna separata]